MAVFSYKTMQSELIPHLDTGMHDQQIEIELADTSELPVGERNIRPAHCVVSSKFLQAAERIHNFTVYEDDVWIVTFPKCGTTWTQEMVWLIDHNLDYETARNVNLLQRSIFFELSWIIKKYDGDTLEQVEKLPRPRHIKSHLPLALLPRQLWTVKPRIVYCARNPKDVAVSYMHHYRHLHAFQGDNKVFLEALLTNQVLWCPQVQHTLDFWNIRHRDHVLFLHFEDMKKDLKQIVKQVSEFFKKSFTEEQLNQLAHHLSFDTMKENPSANNSLLVKTLASVGNRRIDFDFMRKGKTGCYKDELPSDYITRLQEAIDVQLKGSDFKFRE
ncbi:sulfotransferase 1B1-like [Uranotaenia lowii]|uniref:sulfotransferase 1B1-like n=1 Tax=Uranotaenia lowii TaxID=190385 RepID=UPI0024796619|nr:sulfotransferase 1B1-like [Uranotaenia lowii]